MGCRTTNNKDVNESRLVTEHAATVIIATSIVQNDYCVTFMAIGMNDD